MLSHSRTLTSFAYSFPYSHLFYSVAFALLFNTPDPFSEIANHKLIDFFFFKLLANYCGTRGVKHFGTCCTTLSLMIFHVQARMYVRMIVASLSHRKAQACVSNLRDYKHMIIAIELGL